jgi:CheY-like chemotaxis protein
MRGCVLVVEDEPLIRMDAASILEDAGFTVVEFDSADDAMAYTETHARDVGAIFTDINLRGRMDGIELASRVARRHPHIAVVVTSGRFDRRPDALPASVRFMAKPWLPLDVVDAMQGAAAEGCLSGVHAYN